MDLQPVISSNIVAIGYDPETRELVIQFKAARFRYADVPPEIHSDLMGAESIGSYFARTIKGQYEATRIDEPTEAEETAS